MAIEENAALSTEEILEILCAPEATDDLPTGEWEESEATEQEAFIRRWIQEREEKHYV